MIIEVTQAMITLADEVDDTNEAMNLAMWNGIVAFLSATFFLPIIQQPRWSRGTRSMVTFIFSLIVGFVTTFLAGDVDMSNVITSILTVFAIAIVTYNGFAKPSGIAPSIENATSPGSRNQPPADNNW